MSPKDEDEIRKLILARRARFVAAALSATGLQACDIGGPSICLKVQTVGTPDGTTSIDGTTAGTSATHTTPYIETCHNPPACVCLSIAYTNDYLPDEPTFPPSSATTTDGPAGSTTSEDTGASAIQDGGPLVDASARDGGVDGSASTEVPANTDTSTSDTSEFLTEPTVCLSILEFTNK